MVLCQKRKKPSREVRGRREKQERKGRRRAYLLVVVAGGEVRRGSGVTRLEELGPREPLDFDRMAPNGWMDGGSVEVAGCVWVGEEG